jgi:PilX N-terminal
MPSLICRTAMTRPGLRRSSPRSAGQRGLATLVVVMVLFFIVAMVAAYTSRNLVFEQRASANQYRSTQALEAADAGLQWALAMLNGGRIDDNCQPSNDQNQSSFRARYIDRINYARSMTLSTYGGVGATREPLMPSCTLDAATNGWSCLCPSDAAAALPGVSVAGAAGQPFFRIRFALRSATRSDVLLVESVGCTRADTKCLSANAPAAPDGDAMAVVTSMVTLRSALATPPGAPLKAAGGIDGGNSAAGQGPLRAVNSDPGPPPFAASASGATSSMNIASGVTVIAGGDITGNIRATSVPGTPGATTLRRNDFSLQRLSKVDRSGQTPPRSVHDRLFSVVFGMWPDTYQSQPSLLQVDCAGGCTASGIDALARKYPGQAMWLNGDLDVDGDIGSAIAVAPDPTLQTLVASEVAPNGPVLLIVNGNLTLSSGTVYGLIYRRAPPAPAAPDWARGLGNTTIRGALISEGSILGGGAQTVIYDAGVLNRLSSRFGSFVRVPGGWKDFQ